MSALYLTNHKEPYKSRVYPSILGILEPIGLCRSLYHFSNGSQSLSVVSVGCGNVRRTKQGNILLSSRLVSTLLCEWPILHWRQRVLVYQDCAQNQTENRGQGRGEAQEERRNE